MVSSVTLDQTCIRALEKNSRFAPYVRALIALYEARQINLCIAVPGLLAARPLSHMQERLARLGLADAEILAGPLNSEKRNTHQQDIYVTVPPKSPTKLKHVAALGLPVEQVLSPQEAILCLY